MRKHFHLIISLSMIFTLSLILLTGCGTDDTSSKVPENMSTGTYKACMKILSDADSYIELELSYEDFTANYKDAVSRIEENTTEDTIAASSAAILKTKIGMNHRGSATTDEVIEKRNDLAKKLGVKEYSK